MPVSPEPPGTHMTRRAFSRRAAVAAAGMLVGGVAASAEESAMPAPKPKDAAPGLSGSMTAQILAACPGLREGDREEVEAQVTSALDLAQTLRKLTVPDGTEPDFVFRAATGASHGR